MKLDKIRGGCSKSMLKKELRSPSTITTCHSRTQYRSQLHILSKEREKEKALTTARYGRLTSIGCIVRVPATVTATSYSEGWSWCLVIARRHTVHGLLVGCVAPGQTRQPGAQANSATAAYIAVIFSKIWSTGASSRELRSKSPCLPHFWRPGNELDTQENVQQRCDITPERTHSRQAGIGIGRLIRDLKGKARGLLIRTRPRPLPLTKSRQP